MKFLFLSALIFSSQAHAEVDWAKIYTKTKPSIPMVFSSGGICAGSVVSEKLILTAAHCVWKLRPVTFSFADKPMQFYSADVIEMDDDKDLALLRTKEIIKAPQLAFLDQAKDVQIGDRIATTGHPTIAAEFFKSSLIFKLDETYLFSQGVVSGKIDSDLITDMSVSPGNSGGPAFDKEGTQVGVVSRKRIGLGVGQVAYVVRHQEVYKMKHFKQPENANMLPWWKAKSSAYIDLRVGLYDVFRTQGALRGQVTTWAFNFDFADRIHFEGEWSFESDPGVSAYAVGWRHEIPLKSKSALILEPSFAANHLNWKTATAQLSQFNSGFAFKLMWSSFPIALKYYQPMNGSGNSVTSFVLRLM